MRLKPSVDDAEWVSPPSPLPREKEEQWLLFGVWKRRRSPGQEWREADRCVRTMPSQAGETCFSQGRKDYRPLLWRWAAAMNPLNNGCG